MTRERAALAALLVLAAVLRATGLGWGLRHVPHVDERYFVENVEGMLARGDLDHRFQEYPGLVFYLLLPVLAFVPRPFGPEAYLAARAVVAAFGVASVALVYAVGRRLAGPRVGLVAAAFLAVSPVEVQTAHMVRPDVVLEAASLAVLLAVAGLDERRRGDLAAGIAVGAATAVKFSGVLVAVSYAAARLLGRPPRPGRLVLAGAASVAAFAVLSPYTFLDFEAFRSGAATQVGYHYDVRGRGEQRYLGMVATYLWFVLGKALGLGGLALAVAGLAEARAAWRTWLPVLVFPVVTIAVFSTAEVHRDRFLVPCLGVLALFAGLGVEAFARRTRPAVALAAAVLAAAFPLAASVDYVRGVRRPGTRDRALDWVLAHVPAGSTVVTSVPDLGLDRTRYEVLTVRLLDPGSRLFAEHAAAVVSGPQDEAATVQTLREEAVFEPGHPQEGFTVRVLRPPRPPEYRELRLAPASLAASGNAEALPSAVDGDEATAWTTAGPQRPGDAIEVSLAAPATVGRIELLVGTDPARFAENLHVFVRTPEELEWRRVRSLPLRPHVREQVRAPRSQVLLLDPVRAAALRIVQQGRRAKPWAVAELRLSERLR